MEVSLVAAIAANGVIGNKGALPWRLSDDLRRFRRLTMGHAVVMGHATWLSMGGPLAGRRNIVLSRDAALCIEGCDVVQSPAQALAVPDETELFVIGGAAIYELFLPVATRMYLTWVDAEVEGDIRFPAVDWDRWRVVSESPSDGIGLPHRFVDYEKAAP